MGAIKNVLMKRDNMSEKEAENLIQDAKEQLEEYLEFDDICSAENICEEFFGLELDYIDELIPI